MKERRKNLQSDPKQTGLEPVSRRLLVPENRLYRLYQRRKNTAPTEGHRNRVNMLFICVMLAIMMSALGSIAWTERSSKTKLESIQGVNIAQSGLNWTVSGSGGQCADGTESCLEGLREQTILFSGTHLEQHTWVNAITSKEKRWLLLSTEINNEHWQGLDTEKVWVLSLPRYTFEDLWVYFDGKLVRHLLAGEKIAVPFRHYEGQKQVKIEMVLSQKFSAESVLSVGASSELIFLSNRQGYDKFQQHISTQESNSGTNLRSVARVVLAVFCILLFLFIDSSPESLALATFMGLKGVGVAVSQDWISSWIPVDYRGPVGSFIFCYADIMQLFFFSQLARLAKPVIWPWLGIGFGVSAIYVLPIVFDFNEIFGTVGIQWGRHVWAIRSAGLGVGCWVFAFMAIVSVWPQKLYWRFSALVVASLGVLVQVVTPIATYFPAWYNSDAFMTLYYVLETHTPYVFALSTFINISTLEARVKSLSLEVAEAREIEKDMALGQTVQKSFMQTPQLPERFGFAHQNEAAVYVSGDIFFVHWDDERQVLTAILNDVTGHGVQAALKASICSAIAESIWANKQVRGSDDHISNLEIYDRRLHAFMDKINSMGEVVSIVGCEFDEKAHVLRLYRVHGVFPIVIARKADGSGYTTEVVPLQSRLRFEMPWPEDSFVLLMSDGLVDSSRTMRKLYMHLHEHLDNARERLDEDAIKKLCFEFTGFETVADDKTLLVIHRRLVRALPASKVS